MKMVKRAKCQNKTSGLLRILLVSLIGLATIETVAAAQGSVCLNNPDFRFDGIKSRTCDTWVAQNAKKRCNRKDSKVTQFTEDGEVGYQRVTSFTCQWPHVIQDSVLNMIMGMRVQGNS